MVMHDYQEVKVNHSNEEYMALNLINKERERKGLNTLNLMDNLTKLSDIEARSMSENIEKFVIEIKNKDLQSTFSYYDIGYCKNIYYNLAKTNQSVNDLISSWINKNNSPFLNKDVTHLSFSCAVKDNMKYFFCFLINRSPDLDESALMENRKKVIELVNKEREKYKLSQLSEHESLMKASQIRAKEQTIKEGHVRPDGSDWSTVIKLKGSYEIGENVAQGQLSPEEVMESWMKSKHHRDNILKGNYKYIGVGAYQKDGKIYWAQMFYDNKYRR